MQTINWRELIQETKNYEKLQSYISTTKNKEIKLQQEISYMESILSLCNTPTYQHIFNSYMSFPAKISSENKEKLYRDLEDKKSQLLDTQKILNYAKNESKCSYNCIVYQYLYKIMDSDIEEWCKRFYCPAELITMENLPFLKSIKNIAYMRVYDMYGEGGYITPGSVIGDLSKKISALKS